MATHAKRSRTEDPRVSFEPQHQWQKDKPQLLGSWYNVILPKQEMTGPTPSSLEFELRPESTMLSGPCTKFAIQGRFEKKIQNPPTENNPPAEQVENDPPAEQVENDPPAEQVENIDARARAPVWSWVRTDADDAKVMTLAPNWFEMLIKKLEVSVNGNVIFSSNEEQPVGAILNTLLYRLMDPVTKKMMCPQEHHFANCLPPWPKNHWGVQEDTWLNYGTKVLGGGPLYFDYQPLFTFPLHPGTKMLPTTLMGKVSIRITFHDSQSHIFRKELGNFAEYRFAFSSIKLFAEQAILSTSFEKSLLASKRVLPYPGVTRLQLIDAVPEGSTTFRTGFKAIYLPEALLIFALPKEVTSGTFKFGDSTGQNVFEEHRINEVQVKFQECKMKLVGTLNESWCEYKHWIDHIVHPVCGVPVDSQNLHLEYFAQGGKETSYPHIYLPLVNFNTKHRIMPKKMATLEKRGNLDIELQFGENGAKANLIYVTYAIYTDINITYDPRTKILANPYIK